jgi:hypothetical protein
MIQVRETARTSFYVLPNVVEPKSFLSQPQANAQEPTKDCSKEDIEESLREAPEQQRRVCSSEGGS